MKILSNKIVYIILLLAGAIAFAASFFDPRFQPVGRAGSYALSQSGLANGQAKIFRPYFDDANWWGDLESYDVSNTGTIATTPNWSANSLLDAMSYSSRRIFTRRDDTGAAVMFANLTDLSPAQQSALGGQDMLDFIRGDTTNEGGSYRNRVSIMGDVVHSSPVYIEYNAADLSQNRVYVGANDGMLHVFNAANGVEEYAYIPSTVVSVLPNLADLTYADGHRYFVDGEITVLDAVFSDGNTHKVLISGMGGGGQGYFALDVTSTDVSTDGLLTAKLLWEINDNSTDMADLGFSFSRALIVNVKDGTNPPRPVAIFGNGYGNTVADAAIGSGSAALFIVDLETGSLIKKIDTGSGDSIAPNGLSSPTVIDLNLDGVTEYVYAGDLNGNVWRFDLTAADPNSWGVAFSGQPFYTATNGQNQPQAITVPPRVQRHPNGGVIVVVGTGRILSAVDVDMTVDEVQSVYGLLDRFNGSRPTNNQLVLQELTDATYNSILVRTSSNNLVSSTNDGWFVDMTSGERIVTPLEFRSNRILFSSTNPTIVGGEIWSTEINYLTGGAPSATIYDMNADGTRDQSDNVDANADGDTQDSVDIITGLYQGGGIVVSSATLASVNATSGIFFINRIDYSTAEPPPLPNDPGVIGGHFDVDTASFIAPIDTGSTDAHIHQYDDKFNVTGVDHFAFLDASLHEINEDITNTMQGFKLLIVNADRSPGGRLVINSTYDENNPASYTAVTTYDDTPASSQAIYSLDGSAGTQLTQLGIYFDKLAILNRGLIPTQTGCVKSNILSSLGDWRNGSLTIWAVAVNPDGTDAFTLDYDPADPTRIVGISNGLLWESTLFWHWKGPCAHEYTTLDDTYVDPDTGEITTVWDFYTVLSLNETKKEEKDRDKKKKKDKKRKDDDEDEDDDPTPPADDDLYAGATPDNQVVAVTNSPSAVLSSPNRASWRERRK